MVSLQHKRRVVAGVMSQGPCSQRKACRYLGLHRSSGRYQPKEPSDWLRKLYDQVEKLSQKHPRLGYRKLTRMLRAEGWKAGASVTVQEYHDRWPDIKAPIPLNHEFDLSDETEPVSGPSGI